MTIKQKKMDKLQALATKWKINRVHLRDFDLELLSRGKCYVVSDDQHAILVNLFHIMKTRDQLFVLHESVSTLHLEQTGPTRKMTISHLRTGRALMHVELMEGWKFEEVEKATSDLLTKMIGKLSERYVMERLKGNQAINFKYNGNGH